MLLALETATDMGGIALVEDARVTGEHTGEGLRSHAGWLLEGIDRLLAQRQTCLEAVTAIAISIGPGSFTGLRVGLATALGLCFETERLLVPVPTLAALSLRAAAAQLDPKARIAPLLDARKGQVYAGLYGPGAREIEPDRVADPLPWLRGLSSAGPVWLLGPGAQLYQNEIESALGSGASILPADAGRPCAGEVGLLGERLLREGRSLPPAELRLRYLRPAEAHQKRLDSASRNS